MKQLFIILSLILLHYLAEGKIRPGESGSGLNRQPRVYVMAIGIDNYSDKIWGSFKYCGKDAKDLVAELERCTYSENRTTIPFDTSAWIASGARIQTVPWKTEIDTLIAYMLIDKQATGNNIRRVFREIIRSEGISERDYFVFLFAGRSFEPDESNQSYLITQEVLSSHINSAFSVEELASYLAQIPCKNQLIISDAGSGRAFSENLISSLFESDPIIAKLTERNRIVLTTTDYGIDGGQCANGTKVENGYLMYYIKQNRNLLKIFSNKDAYEMDLIEQELRCRPNHFKYESIKYVNLYAENDYRKILQKHYHKSNASRGGGGIPVTAPKSGEGKIYGLFIATNTYNKDQSSWRDLKNPINDIQAISGLLESKFGVEITKLIDPTKKIVLNTLLSLSSQIGEKDKFIFFVAGHGHLDYNFGGALAFSDCLSLKDDRLLESYLPMSTLEQMLDFGIRSKQVLAIFDVCFGSSFDLNAPDINLSDYRNGLDISLDKFIERKNDHISRIYIASGKGEVPDYWNNSLNHSPFAKRIIHALEEEKSFISPGKLYSSLQGNATEPYLKRFGKHEENGDFILKVVSSITSR